MVRSRKTIKVAWLTQDGFFEKIRPDLPFSWTVISVGTVDEVAKHSPDLLVISAGNERGSEKVREGLEELQTLRREFRLKAPAIVYSGEPIENLSKHYSIVAIQNGTTFLPDTLTSEELISAAHDIVPLSDSQLDNIIRWHSGLQGYWSYRLHECKRYFLYGQFRDSSFDQIVRELKESVEKYATDQGSNLDAFLTEVSKPTWDLSENENNRLWKRFWLLHDGLSGRTTSIVADAPSIKSPPKGLTKLLYVDDKPQDYIGNRLATIYGYQVEWVTTMSSAIHKLTNDDIDIVLCDLHLKKYDAGAESATHGIAVMKKAIDKSLTNAFKPLVICTSFTDPPNGILPDGVLRCTGRDSQSPDKIHSVIWHAAGNLGIDEPDDLDWKARGAELSVRSDSAFWNGIIPDLRSQWASLARAIEELQNSSDITGQLHLEPSSPLNDGGISLTVEHASAIAEAAEQKIQSLLKASRRTKMSNADTELYQSLHLRFRKFGLAINCLADLRHACSSFVRRLQAFSAYKTEREVINGLLDSFSFKEFPDNWLGAVQETLSGLLDRLPDGPVKKSSLHSRATTPSNVIVYCFETDPTWRAITHNAVLEVESVIKDGYRLRTFDITKSEDLSEIFSSSGEALKSSNPSEEQSSPALRGRSTLALAFGSSSFLSHRITVPSSKKNSPPRDEVLVKWLTDKNVPVVCVSSGGNLAERRAMRSLGLPEEHRFVSKAIPRDEYSRHLTDRLGEMLKQPPKVVIEMVAKDLTNIEFRLNGIRLRFDGAVNNQRAYENIIRQIVIHANPDSGRTYTMKSFRLEDLDWSFLNHLTLDLEDDDPEFDVRESETGFSDEEVKAQDPYSEKRKLLYRAMGFLVRNARKNFVPIDTKLISSLDSELEGVDVQIGEDASVIKPKEYELKAEVRIISPEAYEERLANYHISPEILVGSLNDSGIDDDLLERLSARGCQVRREFGESRSKPDIVLLVANTFGNGERTVDRARCVQKLWQMHAMFGLDQPKYLLLTNSVGDARFISQVLSFGIGLDNIVESGRVHSAKVLTEVLDATWKDITMSEKLTAAQWEVVHSQLGPRIDELPEIDILEGHETGSLHLRVNGIVRRRIHVNVSKKLRFLLVNCNQPIGLEQIAKAVGEPVNIEGAKTWFYRRLRQLSEEWFNELDPTDAEKAAKNCFTFKESTGTFCLYANLINSK